MSCKKKMIILPAVIPFIGVRIKTNFKVILIKNKFYVTEKKHFRPSETQG